MSKSQLKYPGHPISRAKAHVLKDSAIMSIRDFYRIKENSIIPSSTSRNSKSPGVFKAICSSEPNQTFIERAIHHKNKIIEYDRNNRQYNPLLTMESQKITDPYAVVGEDDDAIKELNILCKNAKINTIRDKQLDERKMMEDMYKKKEGRLDLMMELEQEIKKLNKEANTIIIDQILDNERVRIKKREQIEKEKILMRMQIEKMDEEEKKRILHEKQVREKRVQDCLKVDQYAILMKKKKKIEEKEEELRDKKYNEEKARREEEYLKEKKRIAIEKEKEIQLLREKQKKVQDKQAEMDAIRAKRDYEEAERKAIAKEKEDEIIKHRKLMDCLEDNEMHKKVKEKQLADEIQKEKEEYQKFVKLREKEIEEEKEKQREKIKLLMENGEFVKKQILENEEKGRSGWKEKMEEGRKIKKIHDDYYTSIEMIKQQKIAELKALNIKDKYILPVEKFNPIKSYKHG